MRKNRNPKTEKVKPVRLERRARVTFFLVAQIQEEVNAVKEVINYLSNQYYFFLRSAKWEIPVRGFTHSAVHDIALQKDPIFTGRWWSERGTRGLFMIVRYIRENVVLFIIDFPTYEKRKLDENIGRLKKKIFSIYEQYGRSQEEIWIVKQDIYRYA